MTENTATTTELPERLDAALKRLAAALDRLAAASERRARADSLRTNLEDELAVIQDDRSRLAVELDGAIARSKSLELANDEVARRLHCASAEIREVLAEAVGLAGKR
jgi:chromosome segregation ATPase